MPQIPGRTRSIWMKSTEIISGENNNLIPQVQGEISSCWWVVATSEELLWFLWFLIRFKIFYIPLVHVISSSTWWLLSLSEWMDYYCWPTPLATTSDAQHLHSMKNKNPKGAFVLLTSWVRDRRCLLSWPHPDHRPFPRPLQHFTWLLVNLCLRGA